MPRDGSKVDQAAATPTAPPPVLAVGFGRGANGKSSGLAEAAWRALNAGRPVIVADGDYHRSRTLTDLFPEIATHPETVEPDDVKTWISGVLNRMVRERVSCVLDLGTENRALQEYCRDLRIVEFCKRRGIDPVALYFLGPEPEDLRHVLSIWRGGYFRPERALLMLNEGVIRGNRTVAGAFDGTLADPGLQEMVTAGVKPILMTRLACMEATRKPGQGFYAAASSDALDPVEAFMTEDWLLDLEAKRVQAGAGAWLP